MQEKPPLHHECALSTTADWWSAVGCSCASVSYTDVLSLTCTDGCTARGLATVREVKEGEGEGEQMRWRSLVVLAKTVQ